MERGKRKFEGERKMGDGKEESMESDFSSFDLNKSAQSSQRQFSPYVPPTCQPKQKGKEENKFKYNSSSLIKRKQQKEKKKKCKPLQNKNPQVLNSALSGKENEQMKQDNQSSEQELITDYPKSHFHPKVSKPRQEKLQPEIQLNENNGKEAKGGMCFQVDTKEFIFKEKKEEKKKKKNRNKSNINSRGQILRRREKAFIYGQTIRKRKFDCF